MNKRIPTGSIKKKKPSRRHEVSGPYAGGALRGAALDEPVQTVVLGLRETELRERHAAPGHQPLEHHERSLVLVSADLPGALLGARRVDQLPEAVVLGLRETDVRERHATRGHQLLEHHERSLTLVITDVLDALLGLGEINELGEAVVLGLRETELRERHATLGHQPLEHHERSLVLVPANLPDALLGVIDVVHLDLRDFLTLRTHKYSRKSHLCQQQAV